MAVAGESAPGRPLLIEPAAPRIPGDGWKGQVEGSSLTWDPTTRVLTYTPPRMHPEGGWCLVADQGSQAPRAVVHVRGDLPLMAFGFTVGSLAVDAYAFVDGDGALLASGIESGVAEFFAGWFRPAVMTELAQAMGVEFREDRAASWRDLNRRYAGLVSGSKRWERLARSGGVTYWALGIVTVFLGLGVVALGIAEHSPAGAVVTALLVLPLGANAIHMGRKLLRGAGHRQGSTWRVLRRMVAR